MNILYLEDSDRDMAFIQRYVTSVGHGFVGVKTPEEAWLILTEHHPDLFLSDVILEDEIVEEFIGTVAAMPQAPVIVAVTARALPAEQQRYIELGCQYVLAKPFTIDQLEEVIGAVTS